MKPLEYNLKIFQKIAVFPPPDGIGSRIKYQNYFFGFVIFFGVILSLISSITSVVVYLESDLEKALYAMMQAGGSTYVSYSYVVAHITWKRLRNIFPKLQKIYDQYKDLDMDGFFVKANKRIEFISKLIMVGIPICIGGSEGLLALASIGISLYVFGEIRANILHRPNQLSLPWDQNTFNGWFGEQLCSHMFYISYCTINGAMLSTFIGFCEYLHAFRKHFEASITRIHDIDANKAANILTTKIKMKSVLCEVIEFHNSIKEFFLETTELYSIFILLGMFTSMIIMSCGLFELDLDIRNFGINIPMTMIAVLVSAANLFLFCIYGHRATDDFLDMGNVAFETNWYKLDPDLQKYIGMVIINSQRPIAYHGFKVAFLNLETFLKMLKTVISYYMLFKTL